MDDRDVPWVGLAETHPRPGNQILGTDQRGAYVTAMALANDSAGFLKLVSAALTALGLDMVNCMDVESFSDRQKRGPVDPSIEDLVPQLTSSNPVAFCSFHTFPLDDPG